MRPIISGIVSLAQYISECKKNIEQFRPAQCPNCGKSKLWIHGSYERQADYENTGNHSLNPVPILRFYCPACHSTCSVLPECIPPNRHYPWSIQQVVCLLLLNGITAYKAHNSVRPSPWTIRRWFFRAHEKFLEQADHLRSVFPMLGQHASFSSFWRALFQKMTLSQAMLSCHFGGLSIP